MRHPVSRLIEVAGRPALRPTGRRRWHRTVVVPRESCVFEQVPCAGVAWHERRGFARLQVARLAPFIATGACAVVRHKRLMLWMWDREETDAAITAAGEDPARFVSMPETLWLRLPKSSGPAVVVCQGGSDHLELERGAIVSSRFEPAGQRPAAAPPLLARPWSSDLLTPTFGAGQADAASPRGMAVAASWLLAAGAAGYLAYWAGTSAGLQAREEARQAQPDDDTRNLALLTRLKSDERSDRAWNSSYARLTGSLQVGALLTALQKPLEAHRLVIKELEARNDDLRLTLASVGNDIDLPAVLQALQAVPGIDAVQLRQNADTLQATYTMRATGFRRPVVVAGDRR
jgi:hypothetical protein